MLAAFDGKDAGDPRPFLDDLRKAADAIGYPCFHGRSRLADAHSVPGGDSRTSGRGLLSETGSVTKIKKGNPLLMENATLRSWHDMMASGQGVDAAIEIIKSFSGGTMPKEMFDSQLAKSVWQAYTATAERYNEPGRFTALIGYEWTSNTSGNNLHRVVIFRDGKDKADQIVPFSAVDSDNPAKLWGFLDSYQVKTGGSVLVIPHNGNLSNGRMFALVDFDGRGLTREYAETRARLEPVYEVTQIKGDGETGAGRCHGFNGATLDGALGRHTGM